MEEIEKYSWEESFQTRDYKIELSEKDWKVIDIKDDYNFNKVAFLDGSIKLLKEIYDKELSYKYGIYSVGSVVCEMTRGLNTFSDSFKALKIKTVLVAKKDYFMSLKDKGYELAEDGYSYMKNLEYSSLVSYLSSMKGENLDFLIWDGSLPAFFKAKTPFDVVGLVKTQNKYFVEESMLPILFELRPFARTPIILVKPEKTDINFITWYSSLSNETKGLVRFELKLFENTDIKDIIDKVNKITYITQLFASSEISERRAPQNLLPITKIEFYLHRFMNNPFI